MLGSVCAADLNNVSDIENSNLIQDDNQLSYQNLEVSSNGSISDNYSYNFNGEYSGSGVIKSNYENNNVIGSQQISNNVVISEPQSSVSNTTLSGNDTTLYFKNGTSYNVKLTDIDGNVLTNQTVSFLINGKLYNRTTGSNGIASININLGAGKYTVVASYAGSSMYGSSSVTSLVEVLSTISANDVVKFYKNGTQYYAKFVDGNGNPLINTEVKFNINGVFYIRNTNGSGIARLNIALDSGKYILTAIHPNGESKGYNIKVLSTLIDNKDINMYYMDGTAFTIKVLDGQGKPLANTTVNFNINGVLYGRVTDENGIAKLNIKLYPNNYIITSSYNGLEVSNRINVSSSNTTIIGKDAHVIMDSINSNYTVTLVDVKGNPIGNKTVYFRYDNKQVTATTDKNGNATITISGLKNGDYNITYGFDGVEGYCSSSSSSILHVVNSTTILTGNDLTMVYNDGSEFKVKLTDLYGKPLANKIITFVINGIAYNRTTDSNGVASLNIRLDPGNYLISYYYSNKGALDYNNGSNNVIITKQTLNVEGKDLVMLPKDGSAFEVKITDKNKKPVKDIAVLFTISGVTYTRYTDQSGVAKLNINLNVGYYTISYAINDTFCQGSGSNMILVNGTIITADDININAGTNGTFSVKLTDAKGNPISGASIKFYYEGITKNAITNAEGIATITVDPLGKGVYPIAYYYPTIGGNYSNSGQSYIHVSGTISIANIIDASKVVKSFIESEGKLPDSVLINGESYTLAQFLYLAAIATININNGDFSDLDSKDAANPDNYNKCGNLGNLVDYISVAQSIIDYVNANGKAPGSVPSNVGTITFDGLVYAFARVVAFYGNNQQLPAYVTIKSIDSESSQFVINRVNVKATESELANINTYLQPTANCQVNDPTIVALAQRLTAGLSTPTQKASAILDYVIDNIAYAGYYDTTRGAKKTLTDKRGNCCDQAHLVIALFRAADLPARYVHGTCTFSSGPIGHVWAQVLIGDTWVVADPVSSRNSLGVIKNWNINTFTFKSYYTSLPF